MQRMTPFDIPRGPSNPALESAGALHPIFPIGKASQEARRSGVHLQEGQLPCFQVNPLWNQFQHSPKKAYNPLKRLLKKDNNPLQRPFKKDRNPLKQFENA